MVTLTSTTRTVLQIRCTQEEKTRWQNQAGSRTLSDYIKHLLDRDTDGWVIDDSGATKGGVPMVVSRPIAPSVQVVPPAPITKESLMSIARPSSGEKTPEGSVNSSSSKRNYTPDWKVAPVKKGKS